MNRITRYWLTWVHARKFAALGKGCRFPILDLTVEGHVELGDRCRFRNNVTLRTHGEGKIIFSSRSGCSWGCLIEASSLVTIGEYSGLAEYCVVSDSIVHLLGNDLAPGAAPRTAQPIHIGSGVFVGNACFIGPGVRIGDGAVVGAHSVVLRDVGPNEIWSGAPARFVAHRTRGVPESKLREYQELVARYGLREHRY